MIGYIFADHCRYIHIREDKDNPVYLEDNGKTFVPRLDGYWPGARSPFRLYYSPIVASFLGSVVQPDKSLQRVLFAAEIIGDWHYNGICCYANDEICVVSEEEIPAVSSLGLPWLSKEERVEIAIRAVLKSGLTDYRWRRWANAWLNGSKKARSSRKTFEMSDPADLYGEGVSQGPKIWAAAAACALATEVGASQFFWLKQRMPGKNRQIDTTVSDWSARAVYGIGLIVDKTRPVDWLHCIIDQVVSKRNFADKRME